MGSRSRERTSAWNPPGTFDVVAVWYSRGERLTEPRGIYLVVSTPRKPRVLRFTAGLGEVVNLGPFGAQGLRWTQSLLLYCVKRRSSRNYGDSLWYCITHMKLRSNN